LKRFRFLASLTTLMVGVLVALAVAVGGSAAPDTTVPTTKVTVTMTEYSFKLSKSVVPRGKVVFTVLNKGDLGHDFVIGALNKRTPVFGANAKRTLTVTFKKKGTFLYLCSVGEHFLHGMKGNLRVR
jgi:plastocyanin